MNVHVAKAEKNTRQSMTDEVTQRQGGGKSSIPHVDHRSASVTQRRLQKMTSDSPQAEKARRIQRMADSSAARQWPPIQKKENKTGLPDTLKSGVERLSGYSMDAVKVHYNSDKPSQLQAHAYAQGTDIHLAPGQEKHLPHEAWHVVQQAQGRVRPTLQMKGDVPVNDDAGLEREADAMGSMALSTGRADITQRVHDGVSSGEGDEPYLTGTTALGHQIVQRSVTSDIDDAKNDISRTAGYSDRVLSGVNEYSEKIKYADGQSHTHSSIAGTTQNAAAGLKAWAGNYYNKAQAYLYEAQKANDHTNVGATLTTWNLARLGQDTDKEPDMQTVTVGHTFGTEYSSRRAIELKTCTTQAQGNVASLVQEGLAQLQKREATGAYSSLLLTVHNDHPGNIYPYTDTDLNTSDVKTLFSDTDLINNRLIQRVNSTAKGAGIKLPLEIRLEHEGKRYATVFYNT